MSDQSGTENFDTDLGSMSLDDGVDAGSGEPDLLDSSEGDNLPATPPDLQPRNTEWGTTAAEQAQDETIDQRIAQEVPDPNSAYGAPDNESGLDGPPDVGGDDPDAIPASQDFLGEPSEDIDGGSLTSPDAGMREDDESELLGAEGLDVDPDPRAGYVTDASDVESTEESAMRIIEE
ncbi:adenosine deaminase [Knoellia sp. Soil729]|uniref:adenosine deaminase n=1 Tax=Knoellia sp. Soil729 TaxID=1736394 RepID=UPI000A9639D4|nr:adenosine deaminase [Knoellia sp. Soil729]